MADATLASVVVRFASALRDRGIPVSTDTSITYARALAEVGLADLDRVYWAGRATIVHRPDHVAGYDEVFRAFWLGGAAAQPPSTVDARVELAADAPSSDAHDPASVEPDPSSSPAATLRYSAIEVLRHRDFAASTSDELDQTYRLLARLRLTGPTRRSRRLRPVRSSRRGARHDMRRTVRRALRNDGELLELLQRGPSERHRRIVLLLDVSGSMEAYARALLRFAHAAVVARRSVEVFALGTRLTRITRQLSSHDPDAALAAVAGAVDDWSGGTRLGEGIRRFNDEWGSGGMARGAIVVVLSDGWDRGDPAQLGAEMQRLGRNAHRVVWVNPLKATEGYAPVAQGMAAALPYVDEFVPGNSVAALEDLARVVSS